MVTIETAFGLMALVMVTAFGVFALAVGVAQIRCVDAARDTARSAARGETLSASRAVGIRTAPSGAIVTVARSGDRVSVSVQAQVRAPGLLARLGSVAVHAQSSVDAEPGSP